jgi:SHS2 domain-containing protein
MREGYRTFDHTGDLGLEVTATSPERLFALAAVALLAQVVEAGQGGEASAADPGERVELALEGDDPADLLVHWLNTALLEAEVRGAVWTRARVESLGPRALRGTLEGPLRDPARHVFLREVKAVSHHALELVLEPPDCRCALVLDL